MLRFHYDIARACHPLLVAFTLTAGAGCSVIFPSGDSQCRIDDECADTNVCLDGLCRPTEELGRWGCTGRIPAVEVGSEPTLEARFDFVDPYGTAFVGGTAQLCQGPGPTCEAIGEPLSVDRQGRAVANIPNGFGGFLETSLANFDTHLVLFPEPLTNTVPNTFAIGSEAFRNILTPAWVALDDSRGHVIARAFTCDEALTGFDADTNRSGVRYELNPAPGDAFVYFDDLGRPETGGMATDSDVGLGAAFNVAPGLATLTAIDVASGQQIGSAEIPIRAGAITSAFVGPDRRQ